MLIAPRGCKPIAAAAARHAFSSDCSSAWNGDMSGRFVFVLIVMCVLPSGAVEAQARVAEAPAQRWGIDIWGLSYHVNRQIDYNETNWGIGVRRYGRPSWKWLGADPHNRLFFDSDALLDSNRGLMLASSVGVEYELSQVSSACQLFAVGAFTVAYYGNAITNVNTVRLGPVPGVAIGCGRMKINSMAILGPHSQPLVAIVSMLTIMF